MCIYSVLVQIWRKFTNVATTLMKDMRNWFDTKAFEFNYNIQCYTFALATAPTVPRNLQFKHLRMCRKKCV